VENSVVRLPQNSQSFVSKGLGKSAAVNFMSFDQNTELRQSWKPSLLLDPFIGRSPAMRAIEQKARKFLLTDQPVLIQGETGTGCL
jgi:DNA-binding NtrC family response regulator